MKLKLAAQILVCCCVFCAATGSLLAQGSDSTGHVYIFPGEKSVSLHDTFDLYISIDTVKYLKSFLFDIEVDTTAIKLIDASLDPFFTGPSGTFFFWKDTVHTFPQIGSRYVYELLASILGPSYYVSGPGQLVHLKFATVGCAVSPVIFHAIDMRDRNDVPMTISDSLNGLVLACVEGSQGCPFGMSHYWRFNGTSGSPYADEFGLPAHCVSCPTTVPGRVGEARQFDANDSVNVADDGSYDWGPSASFSIEFWMQKSLPCTGNTTSNNEVIVSRYDSGPNSWWLGVNCNASLPAGQGRIQFRLGDSGGLADLFGTTSVVDGVWHHIAAVRDGGSATTSIYVDGAFENAVTHAYSLGFSLNSELLIGHFNIAPYYHYLGSLDELALYDRALTPGEISDHYQRGLSGVGYCSLCGDANGDGSIDISDAVFLISYIFSGGTAPAPLLAGDANCDGGIDISDVVYLIAYIFSGGPAPCANCP